MGPGIESLIVNGIFGLLFIIFGKFGDHLDEHPMGRYCCPSYCSVDHEHVMEDYGHISDNRNTGNTCGCSSRARVGLHVSDKVYNEGCCKGPKGPIRDNCKTNRHKQSGKGRD